MGRQDWETPPEFFSWVKEQFGAFTLDAAADWSNTKCPLYYSEEIDALKQSPMGETIWCNPPYATLMPWIDTFISWSEHNTIVALLPASISPMWFKRVIETANLIYLLSPRINFVGTNTGNRADNILSVWKPGEGLHEIIYKRWT